MTLYIGLMSGTSMDGIDAALVDLTTNTLCLGITKKYADEVKNRINSILDGSRFSLASICQLHTLIGREFATVANELLSKAQLCATEIRAIGSHGQTICHNTNEPIPYTLQLGCGHTISSLTKTTVVADFRTRDLVNGGQGAPFAPLYHQKIFARKNHCIAVVNIGGISNITIISPNEPTKGWDIGPGNCLMDAWISKHQGKSYDVNGTWANQGRVIQTLLEQLLNDPVIQLLAPKSLGKEYFCLNWLMPYLKPEYNAVDIQMTLLAFTVKTIADAVLNAKQIKELYLCGGGTHNLVLRQMLTDLLPNVLVKSSAEAGIDPDYLEAMMFAWLAEQTLNHTLIDLSTITGSKNPAILGAIYPYN